MLSGSSWQKYMQYKTDTDAIVDWLATTAKQYGYTSDVVQPTHPVVYKSTKEPRLKGKARKAARAEAVPTASNTASLAQTKRVPIREFVSMAELIAASKHAGASMPKSVSHKLQRAIRLRQEVGALYDRMSHAREETGPASGHSYIIATLQTVGKVLRVKEPGPQPQPVFFAQPQEANEGLRNTFTALELEDTHETDAVDPMPDPLTRPASRDSFSADLSESNEESVTASICIWGDVHAIKQIVRQLWKAYQSGLVDLVAASVATDTAIGFVQHIQTDFEQLFGTLSGVRCIYCIYLQETQPGSSPAGYLGENCAGYSRSILQLRVNDLLEDSTVYVPTVAPDWVDVYDTTPERAAMTAEQKGAQDFKMVMGMLAEYEALILSAPVTSVRRSFQAEHNIFEGIRELRTKKIVTFWLSVAMQIHLDIRHILREDVVRGFDDLMVESTAILKTIDTVTEMHDTASTVSAYRRNSGLRDCHDLISRWTTQDYVASVRNEQMLDPSAAAHIPDYYLLKRDPLWCGLLLYNFRTAAYEGAIVTINKYSFVLSTAHLYNALQQNHLLSHNWHDMDAMLSKQTSEYLFIGDRPQDFVQCRKRMWLAIGMSPRSFASDRRRGSPRIDSSNARHLRIQVPVTWAFKGRYCDSDNRDSFGSEDVRVVLQKAVASQRRKISTKMSALVMGLAAMLQMEAEEIRFEYFQLHIDSYRMLKRVGDDLRDLILAVDRRATTDETLPVVVLVLLEAAMKAERRSAMLGADIDGHCPPMAAASRLVDDMLRVSTL
ncbi:hypothetical protein LTR95_008919 [Oleoguttula sp. CCFEE 5521]